MGIFKEQVLEERARHAEAQAMNLAERADSMTARLAEALTRLRAYEPEYVAGELGEEYQHQAPLNGPPNDNEIFLSTQS